MVKPIILIAASIPIIIAVLIAIPLVTKPEIPFSAANPADRIEIEYTKHQLKKISHTVAERVVAQKSEILIIENNGEIRYTSTIDGYPNPEIRSTISEDKHKKLKALIKETGFVAIPSESFPVLENVTEYQKSNVKIIVNSQTNQVHWPEQNATAKFIPPIITMVASELDSVIKEISE